MTALVNIKINYLELTLISDAIENAIVSMKNHLETQALFDDDHSDFAIDIASYVSALEDLKERGEKAFQDSKAKGVSDFELPSFFVNIRIYRACLIYFVQDLKKQLIENKFASSEKEICFEKVSSCEQLIHYLTECYDIGISELS